MNNKTTRPIFTVEFKQSAVKLVTEQGYIRLEAANNLGISLSAITRWVRTETQYDSKPGTKQSTLNITERAELI
jgi:transposase